MNLGRWQFGQPNRIDDRDRFAVHYRQVADLLLGAGRVVVLTGAGISTSSGIPDFRSPGTGMWEFVDPMQIASLWGFLQNPRQFYDWIRPFARLVQAAVPNSGHLGFATLERAGLVQSVITQNIDDLHQRAGSSQVLQVHGSTATATCLSCGAKEAGPKFWTRFLQGNEVVPRCPDCGGIMKPDLVLFGEDLPPDTLVRAQEEALACDLMIVAGTSLDVMPVADLPRLARRSGAKLVVLNLGYTQAAPWADVVIDQDLTHSIPRIVECCLQRLEGGS